MSAVLLASDHATYGDAAFVLAFFVGLGVAIALTLWAIGRVSSDWFDDE